MSSRDSDSFSLDGGAPNCLCTLLILAGLQSPRRVAREDNKGFQSISLGSKPGSSTLSHVARGKSLQLPGLGFLCHSVEPKQPRQGCDEDKRGRGGTAADLDRDALPAPSPCLDLGCLAVTPAVFGRHRALDGMPWSWVPWKKRSFRTSEKHNGVFFPIHTEASFGQEVPVHPGSPSAVQIFGPTWRGQPGPRQTPLGRQVVPVLSRLICLSLKNTWLT